MTKRTATSTRPESLCPCEDPNAVNHDQIVAWLNTAGAWELLDFIEWATMNDVIGNGPEGRAEILADYGVAEHDHARWPIFPRDLESFARDHHLDESIRTFRVLNHIHWVNNTKNEAYRLQREAWQAERAEAEQEAAQAPEEREEHPSDRRNRRGGGIIPRLDRLEDAVVELAKLATAGSDIGDHDAIDAFVERATPPAEEIDVAPEVNAQQMQNRLHDSIKIRRDAQWPEWGEDGAPEEPRTKRERLWLAQGRVEGLAEAMTIAERGGLGQ